MKKINTVITLTFIITGLVSLGQSNFKWDVTTDSLENNKSELYSKTKLFIEETWKLDLDVVVSEFKEEGVILLKSASVQNLYYQMNDHKWTFNYIIKFMIKDNKCRILIEDVYCSSAITSCIDIRAGVSEYEWPKLPVSETYPESKGLKITRLNKGRYLKIMTSLKQELQSIVDSYSAVLKKPLETNDSDW